MQIYAGVKTKSVAAVEFNADERTIVSCIAVCAALSGIIFDRGPARRYYRRRGWQKRWPDEGRGKLLPLRADAPSMADPTDQLNHVMGASLRNRRILNKTEARVFSAVEKALEQTDTGWREMAQENGRAHV